MRSAITSLSEPSVHPDDDRPSADARRRRIVVVDSCSLRRTSLHLLLASQASDFDVESAADIATAVGPSIDAVLLSVDADHDVETVARAALAETRAVMGDVPVAIIGERTLLRLTHQLLGAGFNGVILMSLEVDLVIAGVRLICAGGTFVPKEAIGRSASPTKTTARPDLSGLTPREKQIIGLVGEGRQNKTIAHALCISEGTVKVHLQRIMRKLGVRNRTEVALKGFDRSPAPGAGLMWAAQSSTF